MALQETAINHSLPLCGRFNCCDGGDTCAGTCRVDALGDFVPVSVRLATVAAFACRALCLIAVFVRSAGADANGVMMNLPWTWTGTAVSAAQPFGERRKVSDVDDELVISVPPVTDGVVDDSSAIGVATHSV
jgi:hypothetical protein